MQVKNVFTANSVVHHLDIAQSLVYDNLWD